MAGPGQDLRSSWRLNADVVGLMYLGWLYDVKPMVTMLPWAVKGCGLARFVSLLSDEQGAEPARRWLGLTSRASKLFPARGPDPEFGVLFTASDAVVLTCEARASVARSASPDPQGV